MFLYLTYDIIHSIQGSIRISSRIPRGSSANSPVDNHFVVKRHRKQTLDAQDTSGSVQSRWCYNISSASSG